MMDSLKKSTLAFCVVFLLLGVLVGFGIANWSPPGKTSSDINPQPSTNTPTIAEMRRVVQPRGQHLEVDSPRGKRVAILIVGQSNAANGSFRFHKANTPEIATYYDGKLYQAADPLPGSNGERGSIWIPVAENIRRIVPDHVHLIPCAIGGTEVSEWLDGGLLDRAISIGREYEVKVGKIGTIAWAQGESDVKNGTSPEQYREKLAVLMEKLHSVFPAARIVVAVSTLRHSDVDDGIAAAQRGIVDELPYVFGGVNTDELTDENRFDGTHFSGEGVDRAASLWSDAILAGLRSPK